MMLPEEKQLLERVVTLSEENNVILRGIRRGNRWGTAFKIIYWVVIIAISYGAYVYIQPYIDEMMKVYSGIRDKTPIIEVTKTGTSSEPTLIDRVWNLVAH